MNTGMDTHPNEDDLILFFYEEDGSEDRARVRGHLSHCEECRSQFEDIQESLALVTDAEVPEPRVGFEQRLWAGVSKELPAVRPRWSVRQAGPMLAWAAAVTFVAHAGYTWMAEHRGTTPPALAVAFDPANMRERVLLGALDQHFDQTETLLVELLNSPEATGEALAFERATADDLVSSGRLYRETAYQTGQQQVAGVLEDLESVLVEVARSPDAIKPRELAAWRTQIEDHGLLFKVRAVTQDIRERQVELAPANKGAL
jgi:hypothetical protein